MNIINEYELVRRLRKDDVQAFDSLYHKYRKALHSNIFQLVQDEEKSRDILQEVFISLWEKRLSLDPDNNVAGWLFMVSYNKSISYLKREKGASGVPLPAGIELTLTTEVENDNTEMQSVLLKEAMGKLSPQKRRVFELCKVKGKSYKETATEMKISHHTVKEYLVIAIQYVKTYVKQHPDYL